MPSWAVVIKGADDTLRLVWKVQRNEAGDVSCVDYATPRANPDRHGFAGITWRRDGHFHLTEPQGVRVTRHRKPLARLEGPERAYGSPALPALAPGLPACRSAEFDGVFELPDALRQHPEHRELHLDLLPPGGEPPATEGEEYPVWLLTDGEPWIAISVWQFTPEVA